MNVTFFRVFATSSALSVVLIRLFPQYAPLEGVFANVASVFAFFLSLFFVWKVWLWPFVFSPLRKLPSPPGASWFHGHFWTILKLETGAPMREWSQTVPNDGIITFRHLFNNERVMLTSPKALAEVLVTKNYEFIKPSFIRTNLSRLLGNGILFAEGDEHKRQRRDLLPAFSFRHVKDLYPVFWAKSCEVTEKMTQLIQSQITEKDSSGIVVNAGKWASRVTLDIIGVAGMGHDFNSVQDENSELYLTYQKVVGASRAARLAQLLNLFLGPRITGYLPIKRNMDMIVARNVIRRTCFDLIAEKKRNLEKGVTEKDILSVALTSGGFSDDDLANQLMTFLAAGHETTASSMLWAAYWLSRHPDMQAQLRAEIRAHLPSPRTPGGTITHTSIDSLPYLNAVCSEILRLTPPVAITVRVAAQDTSILGQPVPKGTTIIISPWAINASAQFWGPDAAEFKPERWIGQGRAHTGGAESNYSFMTFLHGPRSCIGQKFAQAEFACLLAGWVGRFEMEFEDKEYDLKIRSGVTSKPEGLRVRMKVVEGW